MGVRGLREALGNSIDVCSIRTSAAERGIISVGRDGEAALETCDDRVYRRGKAIAITLSGS